MKFYFQSGKKRLAINTETKSYSTNYFFLGGWKEYVKVSALDYRELLAQCIRESYVENDNAIN